LECVETNGAQKFIDLAHEEGCRLAAIGQKVEGEPLVIGDP
jgi:hypothetical protein